MSDTQPGSYTIGPYPVIRHLAQGGMAAIYLVQCPETGEHKAMKLAATADARVARFQSIFDSLSRLDHPNLIRVQRIGTTEDGRPYLIFDLFEGVPAQVHARSIGTPGCPGRHDAVVTIAIQLADVLHYLHSHDIIHRDVKSANVLVGPGRDIRIIDFGSAILPGTQQTDEGVFVGTYTYAPPEQIRGHTVDGRADIYAMGILLYRLFSGIRPFHSEDSAEVAQMHLNETPAPLLSRVPDLSEDISDLVVRMLAKDREDRPATARDVGDALREV